MLIRWATAEERRTFGFDKGYGEFEVLAAVDRMSRACLGIAGFSRESKTITSIKLLVDENPAMIAQKLTDCANRQLFPAGSSFHYKYPQYAEQSAPARCPCCNALPMPEGMEEMAELTHSWVLAERVAQGRLFGKCAVVAKYHSVLFYDMPPDIMAGYMQEIQLAARVLHAVTDAVKINFEIHANSGPHTHCHLFPRYLDDDFPSAPIDYRMTEPSPYESEAEFRWFVRKMKEGLCREVNGNERL